MKTNFVQQSYEIIKQALQKDNTEDHTDALSLYRKGIQHLMTSLKYEKNPAVQSVIRDKVRQYLKRAEEIKSILEAAETSKKKQKKKKKRKYDYPTQENITQAMYDATQQTIYCLYGYIHETEKLLNTDQYIPKGIIHLCLTYFHIPSSHSSNPLSQNIVFERPRVTLEDVVGLETAKQVLKETIILPIKFPTLFTTEKKSKPTTVLLYGAPGTGKTLLSKAIANCANVPAFVHISMPDLFCKCGGDSAELLRNLFSLVRDKLPSASLIVFDEIDAFQSGHFVDNIATEWLAQMEAIHHSQIVIIGITNRPWNLQVAVRRMFEKRIYIPMPDGAARRNIFKLHVGNTENLCDADYVSLAEQTEGFSGSDISAVTHDAIMETVRAVRGADEESKIVPEPLEMRHFSKILETARNSVSEQDVQRYVVWGNAFE